MKTFRMKADVTFEADSIDDAFDKLSHHFEMVSLDVESGMIFTSGEITISPEPEKDAP